QPRVADMLATLPHAPARLFRINVDYRVGGWPEPRPGEVLGRLALRPDGDQWLRSAVLSSLRPDNLGEAVRVVLGTPTRKPPATLVEALLRLATTWKQPQALVPLLRTVATADNGRLAGWQFRTLTGLLDTLDQTGRVLATWATDGPPELKAAIAELPRVLAAARVRATDKAAPLEERLAAVPLLGREPDRLADDLRLLADLLTPQTHEELQAAAVAALGRISSDQVPGLLLGPWRSYAPARRHQVLDVLLSRPAWANALLDAVASNHVGAGEIDAARRQRLLDHREPALRERAAKLLAQATHPDRQQLVEAYQRALTTKGDPQRGAALFAKHCASCHRLGNVGHAVGPDLASVGDRSTIGLLVAILDPNRVVETRYLNYTALLKNGRSITGLLAHESGNSLTLLGQDGKQEIILRSDLDELISLGKSPMPEGLEREIPPPAMADLIAFLQASAPAPQRKVFPGNQPTLVRPGPEGELRLTAGNCEIYGRTLRYEPKHRNLGWWTSDDDEAVWEVEVPRTGRYAVTLEWACADSSAGKTFVLDAGANRLTGRVAGTGAWDNYRREPVGTIVLSAGRQRLTLRAAGKLNASPLLDLREVRLEPADERPGGKP
ncbi:MAG: c-type cytochrome, partial [Gemmataceae bacterium]|nr:c-type cytochrome [Gemmataceae bacterium]MDW8267311.1 c-type cytochrome [Gemmataceae bacterium]